MSKHNKANKQNYDQAGRLSTDDLARERMNQGRTTGHAKGKENVIGKTQTDDAAQGSTRPRSEREREE